MATAFATNSAEHHQESAQPAQTKDFNLVQKMWREGPVRHDPALLMLRSGPVAVRSAHMRHSSATSWLLDSKPTL